ncbi:MAG: cyclic pyranopterin monophosphate synthase MoaC [Rhodospirillales bacterium]|nr:cyclic pyranopterin monophosphate synthase MoaC [Rhodospirillales bacterium]
MARRLTHIDRRGNARMVDVSAKAPNLRSAIAKASVIVSAEALAIIRKGKAKKGDVLGVAQLAGIMAAKRTPDLIPLCHPLELSKVEVTLAIDARRRAVDVTATCTATGRTGVEMEAMTAVSVAALTVYDMMKSVDRGMRITDIRLVRKSGGKSGLFTAD